MSENDAAKSRAAPIDYVPGLLRGAAWVLLCAALVAAAAFGFSKLQTKKYTAAASLVFNDNRLGRQLAGLPLATTSGAQGQQASDLKLVRSAGAAAQTARALDHGLTAAKVRAALRITAPGAWNVVKASATTSSRALAAAIANTYTAQFVKEQRRISHASYAAAVKRANKQLGALSRTRRFASAGLALRVRAQSLRTLSRLGADNVQIAHAAAVPTSPSSPRVARNTILGAVIGLVLGLGIASWRLRRQRRIRNPQQLRQIYGAPLLGVIPESAALARLARLAASRPAVRSEQSSATLPRREEEAFELIRGHLRYFKIDRELRTLLVVSASPRDGRTTIARHLAATAARTGSVVLLVEADLQHPTLAAQLSLRAEPGLSAALIGELSLWSATQLVDVGFPRRDGQVAHTPGSERVLDVVAAGEPLPPNPGELMKSRAMAALLEEARSTYDLVVIDTPALAASADALSLARQVDGVIVVGRMGGRGGPAERARAILARSRAPLLGVVANRATRGWRRRSTQDYDDAGALTSPALDASANGGSAPGAGVEQTERRGREPQPH